MQKRGQITIFILVGVVLLLTVGVSIVVINEVSTSRLAEQESQIISTIFDVESINQFVDTCVEDALNQGLFTLGAQGGVLEADQRGALDNFLQPSASISSDVLAPAPLYPCPLSFVDEEPDFCRFPSEQSLWLFGRSNLPRLEGGRNSIQAQLERFIIESVEECVQSPDQSLASDFDFSDAQPRAVVSFGEQGVRAVVSLSVALSEEEGVTQLLTFSATSPIRFKQLYEAAEDLVTKDVTVADFDLEADLIETTIDSEFLNSPSFLRFSTLQGVNHDFIRNDLTDFLVVQDPLSPVANQPFLLRLQRENRPPALFYIQRFASAQDLYDVLLVAGEQATIQLRAIDPDEDEYGFGLVDTTGAISINAQDQLELTHTTPGWYNFTVTVNDGNQPDWQEVRLLVDRALQGSLDLQNRYDAIDNTIASLEDPLIINLSQESRSLDPHATYSSRLDYFIPTETGVRDAASADLEQDCIIIPGFIPCDQIDTLNIETMNETLFNERTGENELASLTITTEVGYNRFSQNITSNAQLQVVDCLPHRNPDHPYPYPYHAITSDGEVEDIDPFLATHACCNEDFTIANQDTICFESEAADCSPDFFGGYQAQITGVTQFCDGSRGNVCQGRIEEQQNEGGVCASIQSGDSCRAPTVCDRVAPFGEGEVEGGSVWCYGDFGCAEACFDEIVFEPGGQVVETAECGCDLGDIGQACKNLQTGEQGTCSLLGFCN